MRWGLQTWGSWHRMGCTSFVTWEGRGPQWLRMAQGSQASLHTLHGAAAQKPKAEDLPQESAGEAEQERERVYFLQPSGHATWPMYIPGWGCRGVPESSPVPSLSFLSAMA